MKHRKDHSDEAARAVEESRAIRAETEARIARVEPLAQRLERYQERNHIYEAILRTLEH